jgi:hypothetical protein
MKANGLRNILMAVVSPLLSKCGTVLTSEMRRRGRMAV